MDIDNVHTHIYDAGYTDGIMDFVEYLREQSLMFCTDDGFILNAVDVKELDELVDSFFERSKW